MPRGVMECVCAPKTLLPAGEARHNICMVYGGILATCILYACGSGAAEASGYADRAKVWLQAEVGAAQKHMLEAEDAWSAAPGSQVLPQLYQDLHDRVIRLLEMRAGLRAAQSGERPQLCMLLAAYALYSMHAPARGMAYGRLRRTEGCSFASCACASVQHKPNAYLCVHG